MSANPYEPPLSEPEPTKAWPLWQWMRVAAWLPGGFVTGFLIAIGVTHASYVDPPPQLVAEHFIGGGFEFCALPL
jgi:hypothetical protein